MTARTAPSSPRPDALLGFQWTPEPAAGAWVNEVAAATRAALPWADRFARQLAEDAAVRFADLIDSVVLPVGDPRLDAARAAGWEPSGGETLDQPRGLFPTVRVDPAARGLAVEIKVENVADFLEAHTLPRTIEGRPWGPYRRATVAGDDHGITLRVAERHGSRGFDFNGGADAASMLAVSESFRTRPRDFADAAEGFAEAERRIDAAIDRVGRDAASDLFFAAERAFWTRRNRAARAQKARQDAVGIGWANHDHHTYRSSREAFAPLVQVWEKLGLVCRERFYAGLAAGWGAQVMEHPVTRVVTFNDVDLSPEELMGDFSHDGLAPRDRLSTIGLWCGLHGEAFLQAGMHHLECVFAFDDFKVQLERDHGIRTMKPFTDFGYLRQAFTEGERWAVRPERIARLLDRGLITEAEASKFAAEGAIGSHLENLERNDGFKGFNQHGVSEIIAATDPRRQARGDAFEAVDYQTVGSR